MRREGSTIDLDWRYDGVDDDGNEWWSASYDVFEATIYHENGSNSGERDAYQWDVWSNEFGIPLDYYGEPTLERAMDACEQAILKNLEPDYMLAAAAKTVDVWSPDDGVFYPCEVIESQAIPDFHDLGGCTYMVVRFEYPGISPMDFVIIEFDDGGYWCQGTWDGPIYDLDEFYRPFSNVYTWES